MNCNPFTLGHRHLIEKAAARVDWLYVFCVEEDRSLFSVADRMRLLKSGTGDLRNVKILKSGKLMISTLTFPDYFAKDQPSSVQQIPSLDVDIFGEYLAPALDIRVRFAGTEPGCGVTRAYNQLMREILPSYGIEFVEINRLEKNGIPISASLVRRLLREGNLDAIADLVPAVTLDYLKARMESGFDPNASNG
jgi:[citrate (pro-3S)-lyase] ligase